MITVTYDRQFDYSHDQGSERFPKLTFRLTNPADPKKDPVDVEACLDSGAQRSLFDGRIGAAIGVDLLAGRRQTYETTAGGTLEAALHTVWLEQPGLSRFELEVGFSLQDIRRNLLGRDFFNLVQVGFREHHMTFFVSPRP